MSDLLTLLIKATLAVSVAIILAVVLRKPVRRRFGARVAYQLWLITPAALLGATLPIAPSVFPSSPALTVAFSPVAAVVAWSNSTGNSADHAGLILTIWVVGVVLSLLWVIAGQQRFIRRSKAGTAGPAVVGVVFPQVVLPWDFEKRFTPDEQQMILVHERTHVACGDPVVTGLITLIQCLGWFNPLVHLAAHLARLDQELACDADVIAQFPHKRRIYANAMLKTQSSASVPLGCSWPARTIHPLEERIAMLKHVRPDKSWRLLGAVLVAMLSLGTGYAASATQDAPAPVIAQAAKSVRGLTMRLVDERGGVATKGSTVSLEPEIVISGDMVVDAEAIVNQQGGPVVRFRLTPEGASRLAAVTRNNIGHRLAMLVDGRVMSVLTIRAGIDGGAGEISGHFTVDEARAIAADIVEGR